MRILVVEDDIDLNETIKDFLQKDYEIISAFDGEEALQKAYEEDFDLIILDVKLPKKDGFEVAKEIRKIKNTPIIFLTSLDSEKDVEKGFLSGGDDYIRKPFSLKELKLRIEALIKRVYGGKIVNIGEYSFNMDTLELKKGDKTIHLKPKVAKLLKLLLQNKNKVVSKEEIFEYLYDYSEEPNYASLRTFINTLRNIFSKESIVTIKDVGYKFVG
ncbi:MAG: response regulator transcription factor [Epsilonproteobacteria bacterium]|nr:response regulator transcription factor [Campylobacterota bacterium]